MTYPSKDRDHLQGWGSTSDFFRTLIISLGRETGKQAQGSSAGSWESGGIDLPYHEVGVGR